MLYFEIYLFCCIKMFASNSFNFSMNEKHHLCIIHFPSDGHVGCFQFFVFKLILQWVYFYIFLCMCGRVTPGGIYQSGIAFPNCSANYTFMLLRKILTLSGILLGFTWAGMKWHEDWNLFWNSLPIKTRRKGIRKGGRKRERKERMIETS